MEDLGLLDIGGAVEGFIQGWESGENRKLKKMELESKIKSDQENAQREFWKDRMAAEYDYGLDTSQIKGPQDAALMYQGMLPEKSGYLGRRQVNQLMADLNAEKLMREKEQADLLDPLKKQKLEAEIGKIKKSTEEIGKPTKAKGIGQSGLLLIPGYDADPNVYVDPGQLTKLRDTVAAKEEIANLLSSIEAKVKQARPGDLVNPLSNLRQDIDQLVAESGVLYKGPQYAQLGVLAGPDMTILKQIIGEPGSLKGLVSGSGQYLKRLSEFRARTQENANRKLKLGGFTPQAKKTEGTGPGGLKSFEEFMNSGGN